MQDVISRSINGSKRKQNKTKVNMYLSEQDEEKVKSAAEKKSILGEITRTVNKKKVLLED